MSRTISSAYFYGLLAMNVGVAYIITEIIHQLTVYLDLKYGWTVMPIERTVAQMICGIFLPVLVIILLASLYFDFAGQDIFDSGFLLVDLPIIICFLLLFNTGYLIRFLYQKRHTFMVVETEELTDTPTLKIHYNGVHIELNVTNEILYFYRSGKLVLCKVISGNEYPLQDSIANLCVQYADDNFVQISRKVAVNLRHIKGYKAGTRRDTLQILFKPEFHTVIKDQFSPLFKVTKEYKMNIKNRCL